MWFWAEKCLTSVEAIAFSINKFDNSHIPRAFCKSSLTYWKPKLGKSQLLSKVHHAKVTNIRHSYQDIILHFYQSNFITEEWIMGYLMMNACKSTVTVTVIGLVHIITFFFLGFFFWRMSYLGEKVNKGVRRSIQNEENPIK